MKRRFVLPIFAVVGLVALSRTLISLAAENPPLPGSIITIAGNGTSGFSGDGGPAAQAAVGTALHLAFDAAGNLFIASSGNVDRVRRISPAGIITTTAPGVLRQRKGVTSGLNNSSHLVSKAAPPVRRGA